MGDQGPPPHQYGGPPHFPPPAGQPFAYPALSPSQLQQLFSVSAGLARPPSTSNFGSPPGTSLVGGLPQFYQHNSQFYGPGPLHAPMSQALPVPTGPHPLAASVPFAADSPLRPSPQADPPVPEATPQPQLYAGRKRAADTSNSASAEKASKRSNSNGRKSASAQSKSSTDVEPDWTEEEALWVCKAIVIASRPACNAAAAAVAVPNCFQCTWADIPVLQFYDGVNDLTDEWNRSGNASGKKDPYKYGTELRNHLSLIADRHNQPKGTPFPQ